MGCLHHLCVLNPKSSQSKEIQDCFLRAPQLFISLIIGYVSYKQQVLFLIIWLPHKRRLAEPNLRTTDWRENKMRKDIMSDSRGLWACTLFQISFLCAFFLHRNDGWGVIHWFWTQATAQSTDCIQHFLRARHRKKSESMPAVSNLASDILGEKSVIIQIVHRDFPHLSLKT